MIDLTHSFFLHITTHFFFSTPLTSRQKHPDTSHQQRVAAFFARGDPFKFREPIHTRSSHQPQRIPLRIRRNQQLPNLKVTEELDIKTQPVHETVRDFIWRIFFSRPTPVSAEQEQEYFQLITIKHLYNIVIDNMSDRLITQANSRLTKTNVVKLLTKEEAWSSLDLETRQELYSMLPRSLNGNEVAHDPEVHPLKTGFAKYIKHFIYEWEQDLAAGRNTAKWQREAKQATGNRAAGVYDDPKEKEREEYWGQKYDPEHFKGHRPVAATSGDPVTPDETAEEGDTPTAMEQ
ncbi:hypothetical protein D6C79_01196 [Aureobasidium pullulans]|nr:hypothetical protein D6C79_01196 [Aureobasidium pullulans]